MSLLYHAHLFTHLSALLDYEHLEGSEIVSDHLSESLGLGALESESWGLIKLYVNINE